MKNGPTHTQEKPLIIRFKVVLLLTLHLVLHIIRTATYLHYSPVVEVVVVAVPVQVGQRHAVELGVGQGASQVGLKALLLALARLH